MGPKISKPTITFGKLTFYNKSGSDVRVTVSNDVCRISEISESNSIGINVGVKGESEKKGAGYGSEGGEINYNGAEVCLPEKPSSSSLGETGGVKGEGENKISGGITGGGSSSVKYDWSQLIVQGERIVKQGTSEEFLGGTDSLQHVKYVTVRQRQGEHTYCLNQKMIACLCFFQSERLLAYGDKIRYGDKILLFNWKYQKFLGWYKRNNFPCGKIGDSHIVLSFTDEENKSTEFAQTNKTIRVKADSDMTKDHINYRIMYCSEGGVIYFDVLKTRSKKQIWIIAKSTSSSFQNSPGVTICEGDTVTFANNNWTNSFMKPMTENRWSELECEPIKNDEYDESCWVIHKYRE